MWDFFANKLTELENLVKKLDFLKKEFPEKNLDHHHAVFSKNASVLSHPRQKLSLSVHCTQEMIPMSSPIV